MRQPYPFFLGLRYTRAKRRNHFISFISLISIIGIILGVTALITVISVMNGFEKELHERILSMASHATITKYNKPLQNWEALAEVANNHPLVEGSAPYVEGQVMVIKGKQVSGTLIRGILPAEEPRVSEVANKIIAGSIDGLQEGAFGIVLGSELATYLDARVGDKVMLIAPEANVTPVGVLPRLKRFSVVGISKVGMYEYDRSLAVMHIDDASKLLRLEGGVTGVRLRLSDMFESYSVARDLASQVGQEFWVSDWTFRHANFFRAVKTEKTVMFVILTLIVAVAAFNIVSTLVMVVTDKQTDIAVLRTLGASPMDIMAIFLVQGSVIGVVGTVLGAVGGVTLALNVETLVPWIEQILGQQFLDPSVYYISSLPSELNWDDVLKISGMSLLLSVLATIYPAWRASRIQPAEALRYE